MSDSTKMVPATVAFEPARKKTAEGVFAVKGNANDCVMCGHGIVWVFDPASLFVSEAHADARTTEVTLPEHSEERTKSTSVTLQPFALLCKISKWMSA